MGMNGPVREGPAERLYPISAMASHTTGNVVDVAGFFRDHHCVPTKIILIDAKDTLPVVDVTLVGQDENHHYALPLFVGWVHSLAVKTVYLGTSTCDSIIIAGINP